MANQPKKYKKFVATAATATLVASAIVPVASAKSFNDVADNNDHKANIDKISDLGYMGAGDNFRPAENLTRGQVAIILANWAQKEAGKTVPVDYKEVQRFEDVALTADDKLLQSAALVFDNEIFSGSNGNLLPANEINRLQMALVLNKAYKAVHGVSLVELAGDTSDVEIGDLDKIPAEHQGVVKALKKLGITAPANFNPNGKVTRGQFATFFIKTIEAEGAELEVKSVSAITSKSLKVTFNQAIENTADVKVEVSRGAVKETFTSTWSEDKKELTLASDNKLIAGKYTVNITGLDLEKTSYEVEVKAEELTSVRLLSNTVKPNLASAAVDFEAQNQYGEKMSNVAVTDFIWSAYDKTQGINLNVGTGTPGKITLATNTTGVKVGDEVVITAVSKTNANVKFTTVLTISDAAMSEITLSNPVLGKDEVRLMEKTSDAWYQIPYTLKDAKGNAVVLTDTLPTALDGSTAIDGVIFSTDKVAKVSQFKVEEGKLYVKVVANQNGDVNLLATIPAQGKVVALPFKINAKSTAYTLTLGSQPSTLKVGGTVDIPVTVFDQYDKQLTAEEAKAGLGNWQVGTSNTSVATATMSADGKSLTVTGNAKGTATITLTNTQSQKVVTLQVEVKDAAVPQSFNYTAASTNLVVGATSKVTAKVYDQYGEEMKASALTGYKFVVTQPSSGAVTVSGSPADVTVADMLGTTGVTVTAATADTSSKVKVDLVKIADSSVVQSKEITFNVLKADSALTYQLKDLGNVYAPVADTTANYAAAAAAGTVTGATANTTGAEYEQKVVVTAKDASGNTVSIPQSNIVDIQFTGTNAGLILQKNTDTIANKLTFIAKKWTDNEATKTVNYVVTIKNPDNSLTAVNGTITLVKEALKPASFKLMKNVSADTDYSNDVELTDSTITLTAAQVNALTTKKLIENQSADAAVLFYAQVEDQYGVSSLNPLAFTATFTESGTANGGAFSVAADGTVTATAVEAGDVIEIQVIDSLGNSKKVKINVGA